MNKKGFSLVECMVAVVFISAMGILIVQLLHKNTLNILWNREVRRGSALADMVLEKYEYLASVNFANLENFNQVKAPANAFFATGANTQGYEGMTITTTAEAAAADGTRQLSILVQWGAGGPSQSYKVSKHFAPGSGTQGGAPVFVYVTDTGGNGVPGFEVRARHHFNPAYTNAQGTNEVIGFTDVNGYVALNNVSTMETQQPMNVYARRPGSSAEIPRSHSTFLAGYYAPPNQTWNTKQLTVSQTSVNTVRYRMSDNDFRPLGSISGNLTVLGPSSFLLDQDIRLLAVATQASTIQDESWHFFTQADGHYEFNNILPGSVTLDVRGRSGSDPRFPPGHGSFRRGYSGYGGNGSKPWQYVTTIGNAPLNHVENYTLRSRPLADLDLQVQNESGNLMPGTTVSFIWPTVSFAVRTSTENSTADGTGHVKLWNLFARTDEPISFTATIPSDGCPDTGYYVDSYIWPCSADPICTPVLTLTRGLIIEGTLADENMVPLPDYDVSLPRLNAGPATAVTDTNGRFRICGTRPTAFVNWPLVRFDYSDRGTQRLGATFSGNVIDVDFPTQRLGNMPLMKATTNQYLHDVACASDPNPNLTTSDIIVSDGSGAYGPMCAYFPISGVQDQVVNHTTLTTYDAGIISVSTSTVYAQVAVDSSPYYGAPYAPVTASNGQILTHNIPLRLTSQSISGTVRDAGSVTPLPGITFDPCTGCPVPRTCPMTTNAGGLYGPAPACVVNRTTTVHGSVRISIPDGLVAGGISYLGALQNAPIANPATPATPIIMDINLAPAGGGM